MVGKSKQKSEIISPNFMVKNASSKVDLVAAEVFFQILSGLDSNAITINLKESEKEKFDEVMTFTQEQRKAFRTHLDEEKGSGRSRAQGRGTLLERIYQNKFKELKNLGVIPEPIQTSSTLGQLIQALNGIQEGSLDRKVLTGQGQGVTTDIQATVQLKGDKFSGFKKGQEFSLNETQKQALQKELVAHPEQVKRQYLGGMGVKSDAKIEQGNKKDERSDAAMQAAVKEQRAFYIPRTGERAVKRASVEGAAENPPVVKETPEPKPKEESKWTSSTRGGAVQPVGHQIGARGKWAEIAEVNGVGQDTVAKSVPSTAPMPKSILKKPATEGSHLGETKGIEKSVQFSKEVSRKYFDTHAPSLEESRRSLYSLANQLAEELWPAGVPKGVVGAVGVEIYKAFEEARDTKSDVLTLRTGRLTSYLDKQARLQPGEASKKFKENSLQLFNLMKKSFESEPEPSKSPSP